MKTKGLKNDFITESTAFFYYQFDIIIKKEEILEKNVMLLEPFQAKNLENVRISRIMT